MIHLAAALKERARELGFDSVGIARAEPSDHEAFLRGWLEKGYHGEMGYLARPDAMERRADLRRTLESVQSVVVVTHNYTLDDPEGVPQDPSKGVVARYARGRDYHKVVKGRLNELLGWLEEAASGPVQGRAYVDTGPILERELAQRAGLGWFGKNTMLIDPSRGSYLFLGVLLVSLDLPADEPFTEDRCGTCSRCIEACPTDALLGRTDEGAPVMDARRCISYLTIEHRGPIPRELRPLIGNRVFGCDICQEVCPFNRKFAEVASEPAYAARGPGERPVGVEPDPSFPPAWHPGTASPPLVDLLETALDEAAWDSFSRGSAIRRAGRAGFARNVCVALGNWASSEAVPSLVSALSDPEPLVRGHAAWALGQVGSSAAFSALEERSDIESDSSVMDEINGALSSQ